MTTIMNNLCKYGGIVCCCLLVLLGALLIAINVTGCNNVKLKDDVTQWERLDVGGVPELSVKTIKYKDHYYTLFYGAYRLATTHDPECPCLKEKDGK